MRKLILYLSCFYLSTTAFGNQNTKESITTNNEASSFQNSYKKKAIELIEKNDVEAVLDYLNDSEIQRDPEIQILIGLLRYEGKIFKKNEELAVAWWKKAALQGNAYAESLVSLYYQDAEMLKDDIEKASQNHAPALENLGGRYAVGCGVEKDEKKAFKLYEKAASLGSTSAQYDLGCFCFQGTGTEKNQAKAFLWWEKAANAGCAKSQMELGVMYINGEGTDKNDEMGLKYLELAANQGLDEAQYKLGILYEMLGKEASAIKWYANSAAQGNEKAKIEVEKIKKRETIYGYKEDGEYLNPGHAIYTFSSGKMECQAEIDSKGHMFVFIKNLDNKNASVKFEKIIQSKEDNSILIELLMTVKKDTDLCAGWVEQQNVNIRLFPNAVNETSLKGKKVYENEKFTVMTDQIPQSDILEMQSNALEKSKKCDSVNQNTKSGKKRLPLVNFQHPLLKSKVSKITNWAEEVGDESHKADNSYFLILTAENFPQNVPLTLISMNLSKQKSVFEVYVDKNNQLFTNGNVPFKLVMLNVSDGEPFECILMTKDKKTSAKIKVIPKPIEASDENGHTLSLCLKMPNVYEFTATGFEPNEKVEFCSISENERLVHSVKASSEGKICSGIAPAVIGRSRGNSSIEIKGKTTKNLKVDYTWVIYEK